MSDSFSLDRLAAFPKARHGYARGPVEEFALEVQRAVEGLRRENAELTQEQQRLREQLAESETRYERIRTARLDERAQDILTAAEQQAAGVVAAGERAAADIVQRAHREAEVAMERSRQELAWARRQLAAERAEHARQLSSPTPEPLDAAQDPPEGDEVASDSAEPDEHASRQPG